MNSKMRLPSFANYENLKVPEEPVAKPDPIPDDIPISQIAEEVLRGKRKVSREQLRLLIELLPFHMGKVPATHRHDSDIASQLDQRLERAKARSDKAKLRLIEDLRGRDPRE